MTEECHHTDGITELSAGAQVQRIGVATDMHCGVRHIVAASANVCTLNSSKYEIKDGDDPLICGRYNMFEESFHMLKLAVVGIQEGRA
eukprot:11590302-Karenia_brevis.AAC.1